MEKIGYNDKLSPNRQILMEEWIAAKILDNQAELNDHYGISEEGCNALGKEILYEVLRNFRHDLFDDYEANLHVNPDLYN